MISLLFNCIVIILFRQRADKIWTVLQTDAMLPKYLGDLEGHSNGFLTSETIASMMSVPSAGDSDSEDDDNSSDDGDEDVEQNDDESDDEDE